jgi:hypothetical protein
MPIWNILYFPPEGERNSPINSLKTRLSDDEQADLTERFSKMGDLEMTEWANNWRKHIGALYQLTSGNFRAYYGIRGRLIIIVHICRKVGQKAKPQDLKIAEQNLVDYEKYKGGR